MRGAPDCLVGTFKALARRAAVEILTALLEKPARYSELRRAMPEASQRLLWERLRELQAAGLVARAVDPGPPITATYSATPLARRLMPELERVQRVLEESASRAANA